MHNKAQRIVMLCPDLHEVGGIGAVSRMALGALERTGCRGEVWSGGSAHGPNSSAWPHRYADGHKTRFALWGLNATFRDGGNALVVAMHLHLAPVTLPLIARGAKLTVFLHGSEVWVPLNGLRAATLRRAAVLIANSSHTIRRFKAANPAFTNWEIVICPLAAPTKNFHSESPAFNKPFALIVSRICSTERHKGHDLLLELWPLVMQKFPPARLMIVGDGDDRVRLQHKAAALGLGGAVVFQGQVDDKKLQLMYQDCAFYVMPSSRLEGFGLAFLEAMRAGKACIGGEGAANEVIVDRRTGFIVGDGDRSALLQALTRLFTDSDLRASMGCAGEERYMGYFTESHFRRRFLAALNLGADKG